MGGPVSRGHRPATAAAGPRVSGRVYYNDVDPFACAWLRALIAAGALPDGDIDERDIANVKAHEVAAYTHCHFFAGIGGWPLALRWAEWPDDRPVWTGSCPCQPFSIIGRRRGRFDARHLWPVWFDLIAECNPPTIVSEQVASPLGLE